MGLFNHAAFVSATGIKRYLVLFDTGFEFLAGIFVPLVAKFFEKVLFSFLFFILSTGFGVSDNAFFFFRELRSSENEYHGKH
jgi:hypothetical protein